MAKGLKLPQADIQVKIGEIVEFEMAQVASTRLA
jgi:hypothetical protein